MVHVPLSPSFICCVSHCHQVYMLYVPLPPSLCAVCPSSTEFYMVYVPVSTLCCYVPLPPSFIWCMSHFHRVLVAPLYVVMSHFHQFVYAVCHTSTVYVPLPPSLMYLGMFCQLLGGSASFPVNAAAKRAFSSARSVYCSIHFRAS